MHHVTEDAGVRLSDALIGPGPLIERSCFDPRTEVRSVASTSAGAARSIPRNTAVFMRHRRHREKCRVRVTITSFRLRSNEVVPATVYRSSAASTNRPTL